MAGISLFFRCEYVHLWLAFKAVRSIEGWCFTEFLSVGMSLFTHKSTICLDPYELSCGWWKNPHKKSVDMGSCGARWHCTGIKIVSFWYWDIEVFQFNQPLSTSVVDITMAWICAVWAYHGHICRCSLFEAVGCCHIKLHQSHFHAGSS